MLYDSHVDTPSWILRGRDVSKDNKDSQVDFPKLRRGGVDGAFFALYTPPEKTEAEAFEYASAMLDGVYRTVSANPSVASIALSPADAAEYLEKGLFSVFIGMENASPIGDSMERLHMFYSRGVRYITLTHNGDNLVADSAAEGTRWGGLSPWGREVLKEMNSLGIMVDLSHASDKTFYDCLKYSKAPVIASHSCCRSLCSHRRNLTDQMLRDLGAAEGYVGINFYPTFLSDSPDPVPGVEAIVNHIERALELCGEDHVGIGSDYDGIEITPAGMENVSKIGLVFDEMRLRGYSEALINKVSGGNLMSVMGRITKKL